MASDEPSGPGESVGSPLDGRSDAVKIFAANGPNRAERGVGASHARFEPRHYGNVDADVFNRFDDDNDSRCEHDLARLSSAGRVQLASG